MTDEEWAEYRQKVVDLAFRINRDLVLLDGLLNRVETEWAPAYHARGVVSAMRYLVAPLWAKPEAIGATGDWKPYLWDPL